MRDDEKARTALFKLSQELQRPELDAGVYRESFWGIIPDRFNDGSLPIKFDFSSELEDIDSSQLPLCLRSPSALKGHFPDAKSTFTAALARWSTSGQNDPKSFRDFLSKNGTGLYAASKRALIMFLACRCGTPYGDTFFLDMTSKAVLVGEVRVE